MSSLLNSYGRLTQYTSMRDYIGVPESIILAGMFHRSLDKVSIPSLGSQHWVIIMPPTVPVTLLSRVITSYEGGSIDYQVWLDPDVSDYTVDISPDLIINPTNGALTTIQRLSAFNPGIESANIPPLNAVGTGSSTIQDVDQIAVTGQGNNALGGAAGGQAIRPEPLGATLVVKATNTSNAARTLSLEFTWMEGELPTVIILP